ncbi:MAG: Zn-dependent alcohol dehydrogenase [Chloroflexi bacterium]|nr:Zn-dependent alcohol dehydrogenase [Chloroflexota bacterium]
MAVRGTGIVARVAKGALQPEELLIDDAGPGEVLVRVQASGVCHTDHHIKQGNIEGYLPCLLGHEGAGIVERVGAGVSSPKEGDYVILAWRAPCGRCRSCLRGVPHLCFDSLNAQRRMHTGDGDYPQPALGIGTFCSHTVVAASQAVSVPNVIPPEQACLIGCGVMTGVGAALYTAGVRWGSTVAVFGCGGVGTSVIQGARLAHARTIIGVDLDARKLEWAKTFGATHVVSPNDGDPVQQIRDLTGGLGADYTFDAVGLPLTLQQALAARDLAGVCTLIGVPNTGVRVDLPMDEVFSRGGSLRVSWYGDCLPSRDFPMLVDWYSRGELRLDELITRRIQLDETDAAFAAMERGETLRSVIVL